MSERNRTALLRALVGTEKVAIVSMITRAGKGAYGLAHKAVTRTPIAKSGKPTLFGGKHAVLGEAGAHIGATGLLATGVGGTYAIGKKVKKDYDRTRQNIKFRSGGV
jgi:hypothetical protein